MAKITLALWLMWHYDVAITYRDHLYMERKVVIENVWSFYSPKVCWDWNPFTNEETIICKHGFTKEVVVSGERLMITGFNVTKR